MLGTAAGLSHWSSRACCWFDGCLLLTGKRLQCQCGGDDASTQFLCDQQPMTNLDIFLFPHNATFDWDKVRGVVTLQQGGAHAGDQGTGHVHCTQLYCMIWECDPTSHHHTCCFRQGTAHVTVAERAGTYSAVGRPRGQGGGGIRVGRGPCEPGPTLHAMPHYPCHAKHPQSLDCSSIISPAVRLTCASKHVFHEGLRECWLKSTLL